MLQKVECMCELTLFVERHQKDLFSNVKSATWGMNRIWEKSWGRMDEAAGTVMKEGVCLGSVEFCTSRPRGLKCAYAWGEQDSGE